MHIIGSLHPAFILRQNAKLAGTVEHALSRAIGLAYGKWKPKWTEKEFDLNPTADKVVAALGRMAGKAVAFDVETDGQHPKQCALRCIGFYDGNEGIIVPLLYRTGDREDVPVQQADGTIELENRAKWVPYFSGEALQKVLGAIRALMLGAEVQPVTDTKVRAAKKVSQKKAHATQKAGKKAAKLERPPTWEEQHAELAPSPRRAKCLYTQNGQYDRMVLQQALGLDIQAGETGFSFDTIVAHHVIAPYLPHKLGFLAALYTDAPYYKSTDDGDAWSAGTDAELWRYCLRDVKATWLAAEQMRGQLSEAYPTAEQVFLHDMWQESECQRWKDIGIELDLPTLRYFRHHYVTVRQKALSAMRAVIANVAFGEEAQRNTYFTALLEKLEGKAEKESRRRARRGLEELGEEEVLANDGSARTVSVFNPASLIELRFMLQGLNIPLNELTATGQLSTAKELLTSARKALLASKVAPDDPRIAFLDYLFAWRESAKVIGTYLYPEVLRDGRVHPSFSVHVVPTGRLSSSGPNCFSGDTELLTPSGWVRIDEWATRPTAVAQWHEDNTVSWSTATQIIEKDSSDWVHITNKHIDLLVTGDHRCPVINRDGKLKVVSAREYPEDHRQLNAVRGWVDEPTGVALTDDALRLLIATQADGSWSSGGIDFSLTKPRKVHRMRVLLTRLGVGFSEKPRKPDSRTNTVATRFRVRSCPVVETIFSLLGGEKLFGPWVLRLNVAQRNIFMEEVMLWDGCATRMNHYASAEEVNADWVQTVFVLSDKRANTRVYRPRPNGWGSKRDSHQVDVSKNNYSWTTNRSIRKVQQTARAYCLSVPSSFVLVRRNGKVMVSGQCQNQPSEIRGMFVARAGHVLISMDWDALGMRLGAYLSQDKKFLEVFRLYDAKQGPKPHIANMAAIFKLPATKEAAEQNPGMYRAAKVFAYAVAYGAGEDTVYEQVREELPDMSWDDFKVAFENYKKTYPELFAFQAQVVRDASRQGFLDSGLLKRRIFFFERAYGESSPEATAMQNAPYQSTGADVVSMANRRIMDRLVLPWRATRLQKGEVLEQLAQVHDELVFEIPIRLADEFMAECKRIAEEKPVRLRVVDGKVSGYEQLDWHLPVDIHYSRRWKPVQARCGAERIELVEVDSIGKSGRSKKKVEQRTKCRELMEVELEGVVGDFERWSGKCGRCGHQKQIDVPTGAMAA